MRLAKVVSVTPSGHAVDIVFLDDGTRIPEVQVMSGAASSNSGRSGIASPTLTGDKWDGRGDGDRDVIAVVDFYRGLPVVLGFLFPQVTQMLFSDQNRVVDRTPSDVYSTTDAAGNTEVYHPSGTYLRIGETPEHEDLTGKDFDGKWRIARNTDRAVHVQLVVANGGEAKTTLNLDPNGNVSLTHTGNLTISTAGSIDGTAGGDISLSAGGKMDLTSGGAMKLTGATIDFNS